MRVSRQSVLNDLLDRKEWLEKEYGFTDRNGWNQVDGRGEEINREYGNYEMILRLIYHYGAPS